MFVLKCLVVASAAVIGRTYQTSFQTNLVTIGWHGVGFVRVEWGGLLTPLDLTLRGGLGGVGC